ncbi:MAG: YqhA family protein [Hyphomicrobiaceae bacterium]|nr:YqhA family protein [Hyphomicrobiaceae bacterium]
MTASRGLLAPFFLDLALLLIKFVQEFYQMAARAITITEQEAILGMLTVVDLALIGVLVTVVIVSGLENFVARIDHQDLRNWLSSMDFIDFTALTIKLLGSIVAIQLLR